MCVELISTHLFYTGLFFISSESYHRKELNKVNIQEVLRMWKMTQEFNDVIYKIHVEMLGGESKEFQTVFIENMAILKSYGGLTPAEKFMAKTPRGAEMVYWAKKKVNQEMYSTSMRKRIEQLLGAKVIHLFSDLNIAGDLTIIVFVFDENIV